MRFCVALICMVLTLTNHALALSCTDFDNLLEKSKSDKIYESYFRGWERGFAGSMIAVYTFSLSNPSGALYCPGRYDDGLETDNILRHYADQKAKQTGVLPQDCLAENMIILGLRKQFPCN